MLCYHLIAEVPLSRAQEWERWMQQEHIPAVLATGCFERALLWKSLQEDSHAVFVVEYYCPTLEHFRRYESTYAPALRHAHAERFGAEVTIRRHLLHHRYSAEPPAA